MKPVRRWTKSETDLNRALILEPLEKAFPGCYCRKITSGPFKRGLADTLCCIMGTFVAIEVKKEGPKDEPTLLQREELEKVAEAGGVALCVKFLLDGRKQATSWTKHQRALTVEDQLLAALDGPRGISVQSVAAL